jgi:hypothetical protein
MLPRLLLSSAVVCLQLAVAVAAPSAAAEGVWLPGPDGQGSATYAGSVDPTSGSQVNGWVVDTTAQGWNGIDDVQVWDGLMSAGGRLVTNASIQLDRPDVAAALNNPYWKASGFSASLPSSEVGTGAALYVYVHTPSKGWWYEQLSANTASLQLAPGPVLDVETPTPLGTVHSGSPFTVHGFAYDRSATGDQGTGVDRVQLYLDGDRTSGTFIGEASLDKLDPAAATAGGQFANAGWQLTFQPNSWLPNISDDQISQLTVYARSSLTGKETSTRASIIISVP